MQLDISALSENFPDFSVAAIVASNTRVEPVRPAELSAFAEEAAATVRARWEGHQLADVPGIAVWRRGLQGLRGQTHQLPVFGGEAFEERLGRTPIGGHQPVRRYL